MAFPWTSFVLLVVGLLCGAQVLHSAEPGALPILAPGVLTVVPGEPEEAETTSPAVELSEITRRAPSWKPHFDSESETLLSLSRRVILRRPVWQVEFAYKSLRMIQLPATVESGSSEMRNVWYLIYRLTNRGRHLAPVPVPDEFGHDIYDPKMAKLDVRCFPTFRLRDHETGRELTDQIMPGAVAAIHAREIRDRAIPLYDSVQISARDLPVSSEATDRGIWGVATWQGVDPRADFVSVYVQGLTNAYRWDIQQREDLGLTFKTLQLNFWRPGDAIDEHLGEFRNGLPSFSEERRPEILRRYRLDSPRDFVWIYRP